MGLQACNFFCYSTSSSSQSGNLSLHLPRANRLATQIQIKTRHVFSTGGSNGIGLALTHNANKLREAKSAIELATGCDVSVFSVVVRDFAIVEEAVRASDPVNVLVCNQG